MTGPSSLPRTGTFSTLLALERLLPGKCYHMARAITNQEDKQHWAEAEEGRLEDTQWTSFISSRSLSASVDFPMSLFWRDLARLYPKAKVVVTVRDPVKWYQSVGNTIRQYSGLINESWLGAPLRSQLYDFNLII